MRWSLGGERQLSTGCAAFGIAGFLLIIPGCGHRVIDPGPVSRAPSSRVAYTPMAGGELPRVPITDAIRLPARSQTARYHEVKAGETLNQIARRHSTSVQRLIEANGLDASPTIQPGQLIHIPN